MYANPSPGSLLSFFFREVSSSVGMNFQILITFLAFFGVIAEADFKSVFVVS
jgi:hypothetical protein